jgi:hypothetical protein
MTAGRCNCQDPAVFGHAAPCPLGGWMGNVHHAYDVNCYCNSCIPWRINERTQQGQFRTLTERTA